MRQTSQCWSLCFRFSELEPVKDRNQKVRQNSGLIHCNWIEILERRVHWSYVLPCAHRQEAQDWPFHWNQLRSWGDWNQDRQVFSAQEAVSGNTVRRPTVLNLLMIIQYFVLKKLIVFSCSWTSWGILDLLSNMTSCLEYTVPGKLELRSFRMCYNLLLSEITVLWCWR